VLAGATMPPSAVAAVRRAFPRAEAVASACAHRIPPRLRQSFVRVGGDPQAKHEALLRVMAGLLGGKRGAAGDGGGDADEEAGSSGAYGGIGGSGGSSSDGGGDGGDVDISVAGAGGSGAAGPARVLVFCNTVPSARSTAHFLGEQGGLTVASLHGGIPPKLRQSEYELFLRGGASVLVCTDAAARGLDFPGARVSVVIFDFPLNAVEYLHRAGRAARAGRDGAVVSLVARRDLVLATALEQAARAGADMAALSADKAAYVAPKQLATFRAKREYSAKLRLARETGARRPARPAELSGGPRRRRPEAFAAEDAAEADGKAGEGGAAARVGSGGAWRGGERGAPQRAGSRRES
jgi:superfamily II DNA/RNA helicase